MGRIVAWDELSPFGIWDELSLGTNRRLGRIVALRISSSKMRDYTLKKCEQNLFLNPKMSHEE